MSIRPPKPYDPIKNNDYRDVIDKINNTNSDFRDIPNLYLESDIMVGEIVTVLVSEGSNLPRYEWKILFAEEDTDNLGNTYIDSGIEGDNEKLPYLCEINKEGADGDNPSHEVGDRVIVYRIGTYGNNIYVCDSKKNIIFPAKLTAESVSLGYSWTEIIPTDTGWETLTGGRTSADEGYALENNDIQGLYTGGDPEVYVILFKFFDDDGDAHYRFAAPNAVSDSGDSYSIVPRTVGWSAHYAGQNETVAICTIKNCLYSFVEILIDMRECMQDGGAATLHAEDRDPDKTGVAAYGSFGSLYRTEGGGNFDTAGSNHTWEDIKYNFLGNCSTTAYVGIKIQLSIDTDGDLNFQIVNTNSGSNDLLTLVASLRITPYHQPCSTTIPTIEIGSYSAHEPNGTWGDGTWTP